MQDVVFVLQVSEFLLIFLIFLADTLRLNEEATKLSNRCSRASFNQR